MRVRYRLMGTVAWTEIPTETIGRDYGSDELGREPRGTIFKAGLRPLAASEGIYDFELVVTDSAGNTTTTLISPAIAVVDGRRLVRPQSTSYRHIPTATPQSRV